jgi:purine-binding chemotaxis protein CheW
MFPSGSRSRAGRLPGGHARPARPRAAAPALPATILAQRAAALAQVPMQEEVVATLEVLEFQIAGETYGLALSYIGEIYPLRDLTPLPGTPSFVRGITSVRGQIFSVIDLHRFFALAEEAPSAQEPSGRPVGAPVVIVQAGEMRVAVLVEGITGVRTLPWTAVQPVPPTLTGAHTAYLHGVTRDRLLILDAEKLLTDGALIVNDEMDR